VGLDVYFRRDIANVLRSAAVANTDTGDRRDAFIQALVAVGLAFGLEPTPQATALQIQSGQRATPKWVDSTHQT
jgi:hypothetical protein